MSVPTRAVNEPSQSFTFPGEGLFFVESAMLNRRVIMVSRRDIGTLVKKDLVIKDP